jgi:two-component system sensor histidine kinase CreC
MTIRFGLLACAALGLLASAALGEDEAPRSDSVNNVSAQVTILQNAIEFSSPDATVTVPVEREGKTVVVRILDEGPGIPAYALNKVFDRFYSLPQPGTGKRSSGLGLCFAREVAHLHHGSVMVQNRQDRQGAEAMLISAAAEPAR